MTTQNKLTGLEIAVIGMSARFPGARDVDEFWNNLENGVETVTFFTREQLAEADVSPALADNPNFVPAASVIPDKHCFDSSFFGYTPREAETMDPQMRIFHEVAWGALEHAGYVPDAYEGMIGLYVGAGMNFYWEAHTLVSGKNSEVGDFEAAMLNNKDFISTRVSYKLNLRGPSFTIHTACSTSLVAVHLAARAVLTGECGMALAGGVAAGFPDAYGYMYQEGMINSPDGHCRAFDAQSKGTVFGGGAGAVVLKRLSHALQDRDTVHAVIKGSAINNDGSRKVGYTAPSTAGEVEVIRRALKVSKIPAESITYIEAHGTGTPLGDSMEADAIRQAFDVQEKNYCAVGSVKSNVGHLDAAAGIAGFIKTALAVKHRKIPPTLHFNSPNPNFNFQDSPFFFNTKLLDWRNDRYPLRAGVNGFGIGGTNAHIVVEEAPPAERPVQDIKTGNRQLIVLSARTPEALDRMTANLADYFEAGPGIDLGDAAYTLQTGRKAFKQRRVAVCGDIGDAVETLRSSRDSGKIHTAAAGSASRPLVFLFAGLGSQHVNMARDLYDNHPRFKDIMDRCFTRLLRSGYRLKETLYPADEQAAGLIDSIDMAQLAVFSVEYALADLLMYWGLTPDAMTGYSFGEYAAACLAGVFSLEDALTLIVERCRLMASLPGGAMTSIPLPRAEVESSIAGSPGISLCIDNGPSCIVGGTAADIGNFEQELKQRRIMAMRISTSHAVHSHMMEPVLEDFERAAAAITLNPPQIPYISNVTGDEVSPADAVSPAYWARHLRQTVRFGEGVDRLVQREEAIFVEIGPGRDLSTLISRSIDKKKNQLSINILPTANDAASSYSYVLTKTGFLWLHGKTVDWQTFHDNVQRYRVPLPTYSFEKYSYKVDGGLTPLTPPARPDSGQIMRTPDPSGWYYLPAWTPSLIPVPGDVDPGRLTYLVFVPGGELPEAAKLLKETAKHVITVTPSDTPGMEKTGDTAWKIHPAAPDHYMDLFAQLAKDNSLPDRIVHYWNVDHNEPGAAGFTPREIECRLDSSYYSLLYSVQAFNTHGGGRQLHIDAVVSGLREVSVEGVLHPVKGTIPGLFKVIPQEHPNIRCRCIDIDRPTLPRHLVDEFTLDASAMALEPDIAYRDNRRWALEYVPVRLAPVKPDRLERLPVKQGGVYLITGGMGGMGLSLAQRFALGFQAKLILVGRTPLPPRRGWEDIPASDPHAAKVNKLLELEALGAEVLAIAADVGNRDEMAAVLEEAEKRFGPVNGVIHAAGVQSGPSFQGINSLTREACAQQFNPKLYGMLVLEELLAERSPDFCIVASSIGSILGGVAFGAYAPANAFIDAYVQWRNKRGRGGPDWISVNWDSWLFNEEQLRNGIQPGQLAMSPGEGVDCYTRILSRPGIRQIIHSLGSLHARVNRWVKMDIIEQDDSNDDAGDTGQLLPRPDLMTPYKEPSTEIEKTVAAIWTRMFGIEKIGVDDNFFELGGDSLKVLTMTSKVHKQLDVEIPVPDFFRTPTVRGIADFAGSSETSTYSMVLKGDTLDYYPLTHAQKRLYVIQQLQKQSTGYNEYMLFIIEGKLDPQRLRDTFLKLIERHESLRTSFHVIDEDTVQKVHPTADVEFELEELTIDSSLLEEAEVLKKFSRAFDLSVPPMFRVSLVDTGGDRYILAIEMHHIISDGLSYEIFISEFRKLFRGETDLPEMALQYKDFALWQNSPLQLQRIKDQEEYWLNRFVGEIPQLTLPYDFPRPDDVGYDGGTFSVNLDAETGAGLRQMMKDEEATMFMVLMGLFSVWLFRLSRQEDVVVGTPIFGRNQEELQQIIGMFVNTLAIRSFPKGDSSFRGYLRELKDIILDAYANQDYPFEELTDRVADDRTAGRNPLFDVIFTLQNVKSVSSGQLALQQGSAQASDPDEVVFSHYPSDQLQHAQFDILMFAHETADSVGFKLVYRTELFKPETVERFIAYYKEITAAVLDNPNIKLNDIKLSHDLHAAQLSIPDTEFDF